MNDNQFYFDPNAFIQRIPKQEKPKIDLNHIERVIYPQPYQNITPRYDKSMFKPKPEIKTNENIKNNSPNFNLSNILKLFTNGGLADISKLVPNLIQNLGSNNMLSSLFNTNKPIKKVDAKIVDNNFSTDSISNYERVKN